MSPNDPEDKKLLISSIQTDRRLLQDNIAMRVRYGWVLIGLIVGVITLISIPREPMIVFYKGTYLLALIGYIVSMILFLKALFASHYGSSYRLFSVDLGLDELLAVERGLHRKALYKNQLSSLYCGESLFTTFASTMVLVIASSINVLKDYDIVLIAAAMGCMFFAGSFFKKRLYRMYQIDRRKLPGIDDSSLLGHLGHLVNSDIRKKLRRSATYRRDHAAIEAELSEMSYGKAILAFASVFEGVILVAGYLTPSDSFLDYPLRILALLLFSAMAGFVCNQIGLTATAELEPSGQARRIASCNPLNLHALVFQAVDVIALVALVLSIHFFGHEDMAILAAVFVEILVLVGFDRTFRRDEDYVVAAKLRPRCRDVQRLVLKDGTVITYRFHGKDDRMEVAVDPVPAVKGSPEWEEASSEGRQRLERDDAHRRKVCRLGLERILSDPESPDEIRLYVPMVWVGYFNKYRRGRGFKKVEALPLVPGKEGTRRRTVRNRSM